MKKNDEKSVFWRFWDKEAFIKIFRKQVFSFALDTPSKLKNNSKYFFLGENKVKKGEKPISGKVFFFFINIFHCISNF